MMTQFDMADGTNSLYGTAVLLVWGAIDPSTTEETALNDWWTNEHLPERLALPGFTRARRYFSKTQAGEAKYLALYEAEHIWNLRSKPYLDALNNPTVRTKQFMPCLERLNRSACEVLSSQSNIKSGKFSRRLVGNCITLIPFSSSKMGGLNDNGSITRDLTQYAIDSVLPRPGALNVHILLDDEETTRIGSSSKSYDDVRFYTSGQEMKDSRFIALLEFSLPRGSAAAELIGSVGAFCDHVKSLGGTHIALEVYDLVCSMDLSFSQNLS